MLTLALTLTLASGAPQAPAPIPPPRRFDALVRADFFAGLAGDQVRFQKAMDLCERTLAKDPRHAEAMVWHGSGLLERPPLVVFTTAYDRYALDAFEVSSVDYLLKPIEPERLDRALSELERDLDPLRFMRIHRATIVNLAFVHEIHPAVDGGVLVRLGDERATELSVARDRVRELKNRLGI